MPQHGVDLGQGGWCPGCVQRRLGQDGAWIPRRRRESGVVHRVVAGPRPGSDQHPGSGIDRPLGQPGSAAALDQDKDGLAGEQGPRDGAVFGHVVRGPELAEDPAERGHVGRQGGVGTVLGPLLAHPPLKHIVDGRDLGLLADGLEIGQLPALQRTEDLHPQLEGAGLGGDDALPRGPAPPISVGHALAPAGCATAHPPSASC